MAYYVKVCGKCKTQNHPSMTYCAKCGADLPTIKQESDTRPVDPPAYAVKHEPAATPTPSAQHNQGPLQCSIVDIRMPFTSMVWFMVKWALAAIPALIILAFIATLTLAALASMGIETPTDYSTHDAP